MKSYTDISQSKKLAEILPLESADMYWFRDDTEIPKIFPKDMMKDSVSVTLACWSLAALLNTVPYAGIVHTAFGWRCDIYERNGMVIKYGDYARSPIDACYEMILKLNELNLL